MWFAWNRRQRLLPIPTHPIQKTQHELRSWRDHLAQQLLADAVALFSG
jgi:hypothetical protein